MTKIQLYELAVATGKSLVAGTDAIIIAEMDAIKLSLAIANAAQTGGVAGVDFAQFQQYVNQTRQLYIGLSSQKLTSEILAERAALQADAKAAQEQPEKPAA